MSFAIKQRNVLTWCLPAFVLLTCFFVVPVLMLLLRSITEPTLGLHNYAELLGGATYLKIFVNTFLVASIVTLVSLVLGYPLAWLLAIMPQRWARIILGIIVLSMWTNLLARTYAWMVLLQRTGLINKWLMAMGLTEQPIALVNNLIGVCIGMTYIMLPFIVLPLMGVLRSIDPSILRAAALCGMFYPCIIAVIVAWYCYRRVNGVCDVAGLFCYSGTARWYG